jgi:ubiquinone/menaquinone biosynthesis C-methylase UbiE
MTERTSHPTADRPFLPAMGKAGLTPFYDLVHRVSGLGRAHAEMIGLADLRTGQRVLDIGCGTGNLLVALGRRRLGVELVGLDPDARALAMAGRKAARAGLTVDWRRGYADELPFPDGSVDRVFSSLMLHHLGKAAKDGMLAEVRRVLRPDGLLVLADFDGHSGARSHNPFARRIAPRAHGSVEVRERIAAAGLEPAPAVPYSLRMGELTIIRANRGS